MKQVGIHEIRIKRRHTRSKKQAIVINRQARDQSTTCSYSSSFTIYRVFFRLIAKADKKQSPPYNEGGLFSEI